MKPLNFNDVNRENKHVMPALPDMADILLDSPRPQMVAVTTEPTWTLPVFDDATDLTPLEMVDVLNKRFGIEPTESQPIFFDTEGIGFHGITTLIQFAIGSGEIHLWETLRNPIGDTIRLLEMFATWEDGVVGFNLTFDWFHVQRLYSALCRLRDRLIAGGHPSPERVIPVRCLFELSEGEAYNDFLDELAIAESEAFDYPCIKPVKALDLMLYARKGPYQITMERKPIYVRNIPAEVADDFCTFLNNNLELPPILFARKKTPSPPWKVKDSYLLNGEIDPDFKNLELAFAPSGSLKDLAKDLGIVDDPTYFNEISPSEKYRPIEEGYAPYAMAPYVKDGKVIQPLPGNWAGRWPSVARIHAEHWALESSARKYASDDVMMTRGIFDAFKRPKLGDTDSTLACMVGSTRWRGFAIDTAAVEKAYKAACQERNRLATGMNLKSSAVIKVLFTKACRHCLQQVCDCTYATGSADPKCPDCRGLGRVTGIESDPRGLCKEQHTDPRHPHYHKYEPVLTADEQQCCRSRKNRLSFGKNILEKLKDWTLGEDVCDCYNEDTMSYQPACLKCGGTGVIPSKELHPAARLTRHLKEYRQVAYRADLFQKLLLAKRLHIDLSVTGTLSNRMAGTSGLNAQGIPHDKLMRICFAFAFPGFSLCGGDFDSFEISIAEAVYHDDKLYEALTQGLKVHALAGARFFAPMTYDDIVASKGTNDDYYDRAKRGFFSLLYGGSAKTLEERSQLKPEKAKAGFDYFMEYFDEWGAARQKLQYEFSTLVQQNIRMPILHKKPRNSAASLLGHTRYFTIENTIIEYLYQLSQKLPARFLGIDHVVYRYGRQVTVTAAMRSALLASCFSIQNAVVRAAANHEIQSTGAEITKGAQCALWEMQPAGIHEWIISIFNFHDELLAATKNDAKEQTKFIIDNFITTHQKLVRCLGMEWKLDMKSWAEK